MASALTAVQQKEAEALRADLEAMEERPRPEDRRVFYLIAFVAFVCLAVVLPYRDVRLPRMIMFAGGIAFALFLVPLILDRHECIILMLLTYLPFNKVVPGTFGGLVKTFNATNILLGLAVIGWLVSSSVREQPLYRKEKLDFWLFAFLVLGVLSLLRGFILVEHREAYDVISSIKRWMTPMFLYYVATNNLRSVRQGYLAFLAFCMTTGLIGLLGIKKFYVDHGPRSDVQDMRLYATSGPNHLGFLMCSAVFLLVALWWVNRSDKRYWLLWVPILACIQTMRVTFSRGAKVGLVAGFLAFAYCINRKFFVVCCCIAVFFAVNPQYIPKQIGGRLSTTIQEGEGPLVQRLDKSAAHRIGIWKGGLRMIANHPLLGVGYGNFRRKIGSYADGLAGRDAHNTYLIVACEMGVPALILFLLFFGLALRSAGFVYRNAGEDKLLRTVSLGFLCMFTAAMVSNLFGTRFDSVEVTVQIYTLTGVIICYERIVRHRQSSSETTGENDLQSAAS